MNIGQFFEQFRVSTTAPKREIVIDPFDGLGPLMTEIAQAATDVRRMIDITKVARECRNMEAMNDRSRELHRKVEQLRVMAQALLQITATHKANGVK